MVVAKRLDHWWKLVRRAAGYQQDRGAIEVIFAICVGVTLIVVHLLVPDHPGPRADDRPQQLVGLLDRYREFEDVDPEEDRRVRRERRHRERALELEKVPDLDLSGTEWPELPNSEVVNASIYTARGRVNGYPDRHAEGVRGALAAQHDVDPERIVMGNGAAELLQAAAMAPDGAGRRAAHPLALLPPVPADGHPRRRPAGGRGLARADRGRHLAPHAAGGRLQPQRPDRPLHARRADRRDRRRGARARPPGRSTRRWCSSRTPSRSTRCYA